MTNYYQLLDTEVVAGFFAKSKGLNISLLVFSLLVVAGAAVALNYQSIFRIGASGVIQTARGVLLKKGTSDFSICRGISSPYALLGENRGSGADRLNPGNGGPGNSRDRTQSPGPCTPLLVQSSLADPLIGQSVVATGTFRGGFFYATSLKLAGSLENFPTIGKPKGASPVPATPCPGLSVNSSCDPKATDPSLKCCAPATCRGRYDFRTGTTSNYACRSGVSL